MVTQDEECIHVKYQGAKPTISDFVTAFLTPTFGEDLTITRWLPSGLKQSQTLKWNGYGFNGK